MVRIKSFDQQNVALHYKWNMNEKVNYYCSKDSPQAESFTTFLLCVKAELDAQNKSADLFEIYHQEKNKLIGLVELHDINQKAGHCYVRCMVGNPKYIGQDYEIAALRRMLPYCFNELGMRKVLTGANDQNTTWGEKLQKLGFRKEENSQYRDSEEEANFSSLLFSLHFKEYQQLHTSKLRMAN